MYLLFQHNAFLPSPFAFAPLGIPANLTAMCIIRSPTDCGTRETTDRRRGQSSAGDCDRWLSRLSRRRPDRVLECGSSTCWVHKMRNILEKVRRRDDDAVKADARAIYRAGNRKRALAAFRNLWAPLATRLRHHKAATGARSTGTALVLWLPSALVA